jgi:hypothetical protein
MSADRVKNHPFSGQPEAGYRELTSTRLAAASAEFSIYILLLFSVYFCLCLKICATRVP